MGIPLVALALAAGAAFAQTQTQAFPYDETADAQAQVTQALAGARADKRQVLVIFGANWCPDCRALDSALKSPKTAEMVAREFRVVKVDVGQFDRNLVLDERYGKPIKKGIPAAVILSPDEKVLYATRAGELSSARRMSDTGVYDFLKDAVTTAKAAPR